MNISFLQTLAQTTQVYAENEEWLPIDPFLLLLLKFFVVLTCFFFWVKTIYELMFRNQRIRHHRHDRL